MTSVTSSTVPGDRAKTGINNMEDMEHHEYPDKTSSQTETYTRLLRDLEDH